jgi:DNA-binding GntR family transcriptional regulator
VSPLSQLELENTIVVRRAVEASAVEEAARHATPADLARLEELYALASAAAQSRESQKYIRRDLDWHISVWESTHNECLVECLRRIVVPLFGFSAIRVAMQPGFDLQHDVRLHRTVLDAIKAGEPQRARRAFNTAMNDWAEQASNLYTEEQKTARGATA